MPVRHSTMPFRNALLFAIPYKIEFSSARVLPLTVPMPPQSIGVIYNYLKNNNIKTRVYDVVHAMGRDQIYEWRHRVYQDSVNVKRCIENEGSDYDVFFEKLGGKEFFEQFGLILLSIHDSSVEGSLLALLLSSYIKRLTKNTIIILGGEIEQTDYVSNLIRMRKVRAIDVVVKGHHIENIVRIVECIENNKDFSEIPAVLYYDKKKDAFIERDNIPKSQTLGPLDFGNLNLDYYKIPLTHFLPKKYVVKNEKRMLVIPYTFIYGCPHRCAFCANSINTRMNYLPPSEVVKVVGEIKRKYKTSYFMFLNNTLNFSYDYVNELCDLIIKAQLDIVWSDCVSMHNLDRKLLIKMRKAGAARLIFGLETGSDRLLKFCDKGITAQDAAQCFEWSHEAGIYNGVEIIAGLPHEEEDDITATINFLNTHTHCIDEVHINPFALHKYSFFYENAQHFNIEHIVDGGVDLYKRLEGNRDIVEDFITWRYQYNEKGGKQWEEKRQQTRNSYMKIIRNCKIHLYGASRVDLAVLFYLYKHMHGKSNIVAAYNSFYRKAHIKKSFYHNKICSFLMKIKRKIGKNEHR
ncbi:MAG: radical SAM protein [Candidatus Omnitrophica bacterium]|nr:radical SAM protein [Candidatus Omnitrophota bacterium]